MLFLTASSQKTFELDMINVMLEKEEKKIYLDLKIVILVSQNLKPMG